MSAKTLKNAAVLWVFAAVWALAVWRLAPDPAVGLRFYGDFRDAQVRQVFEQSGHFHLEVSPKSATSAISSLTIAGIPLFTRKWLETNVDPTFSLGESAIVDFPLFFDLLSRLFPIARAGVAILPAVLLLLQWLILRAIPFLVKVSGRRTFLFCLAVFTLLSLPEPVVATKPNLDPSWAWFLCRFAFTRVFGSDVVFTYGPLGFLLNPQYSWGCVIAALAANLIFAGLWVRLLLKIYRSSDCGRAAAWGLLFTLVIPVVMEWRWSMLAVLHCAAPLFTPVRDEKSSRVDLTVAGALAAFVGLMKFSALTVILGSHAFCLAAVLKRDGKAAMPGFAWYGLGFVAVFSCFSFMCFASPAAWLAWVRGSLYTAAGYNLYMVSEKPIYELALPFILISAFIFTAGWRRSILFTPVLFLTAKYAWVRQSSFPLAYSTAVLAAFCLWLKAAGRRRAVACIAAVTLSTVLVKGIFILPYLLVGIGDVQAAFGLKPVSFLRTLTLPCAVRDTFARSAANLKDSALPGRWRDLIADGGVAFLPFDYGPAMVDGSLKIRPLPSLQLYSGCHPYLDGLNASFFERGAPDWVVCGFDPYWSGYFIDYPRTWKALIENYEVAEFNRDFALMRKRGGRRSPPPSQTLRYSPELRFSERLSGMVFRRPVEYAVLTRDDGCRMSFQFVRGNQGVDFPLAWVPFDKDDIIEILKGGVGRTVSLEFPESPRCSSLRFQTILDSLYR
ncbi:MAG: hypothetical protein J6T01_03480 [Kiritimatiellae bacterium]|nr:hypothetical protein [Kiritimatiellia bacterium]